MKHYLPFLFAIALGMMSCNQNEPTYRTGKDLSVKGHCFVRSIGVDQFLLFSDSTFSLLHGPWMSPELCDTIYSNIFYWQEQEVVKVRIGYNSTSKNNYGISIMLSYGDFIVFGGEVYQKEY